ncbi:hypothetical protein [Halarchaeum salinum]|uniref:Transcription factor TFIIB cyclin-like domain-containing protein n=1 Tax=Halarchaeum salinum TaxID=489912 RepID=A0AAV3S7G8_9EURY
MYDDDSRGLERPERDGKNRAVLNECHCDICDRDFDDVRKLADHDCDDEGGVSVLVADGGEPNEEYEPEQATLRENETSDETHASRNAAQLAMGDRERHQPELPRRYAVSGEGSQRNVNIAAPVLDILGAHAGDEVVVERNDDGEVVLDVEEDRQKRLIPDGGESEAARLAEDAVRDLERSTETVERARGYARRAELEHPINRSPRAVAAASVYLAAMMNGEKATQAAVSGAVGVNPQTLRDALGEISEAEEEFQVGTGSGKSHEEPAEPAGMIDAIRGWFA